MKTIVITGSPGAGKNTVTNSLVEKFRILDISHITIDPDELARVHPENFPNIKWDTLWLLYPFYKKLSLDYIIIPVTLDDDNDYNKLQSALGNSEIQTFNLIVDIDLLKKRLRNREPNDYWRDKLVGLAEKFSKTCNNRNFEKIDIKNNDGDIHQTVEQILEVLKIKNMIIQQTDFKEKIPNQETFDTIHQLKNPKLRKNISTFNNVEKLN